VLQCSAVRLVYLQAPHCCHTNWHFSELLPRSKPCLPLEDMPANCAALTLRLLCRWGGCVMVHAARHSRAIPSPPFCIASSSCACSHTPLARGMASRRRSSRAALRSSSKAARRCSRMGRGAAAAQHQGWPRHQLMQARLPGVLKIAASFHHLMSPPYQPAAALSRRCRRRGSRRSRRRRLQSSRVQRRLASGS